MILVRYILILMIVYLLVKGFVRSFYLEDTPDQNQDNRAKKKEPVRKISRNVGELIDYEEVDKKDERTLPPA
jgi:hypothetical protein